MSSEIHVGTRKGLFRVARRNGRWDVVQAALLGDPVTMTLSTEATGLVAAQSLGHFGCKIKRSRDGGETWEDRPVPVYPPRPDEADDVDPGRGTPIPWDLKTIWSLEAGGDGSGSTLWCGTIPGGLFRSDDGGDGWSLVTGLWNHEERKKWFGGGADWPGIHSVLVDPRNPRTVRIGVSCGGLWISDDDGASWRCEGRGMRAAYMPPEHADDPGVQDPHCIVQCRAAPDRLWIQHHNGIFKSSDGGQRCEEIATAGPSTFGFPVAVHPADPDTAWFVPGVKDEKRYPVDAALAVTRTRDGGKTFDELREGLPQRHCYDLVYRHALDVDAAGERLAFGSTTGNLWISEDQGDSWQRVSSTLPPVYSVRFASP